MEQAGNRKLKLYIAASMDGYIAGPNGEIDWLEAAGNLDYGYHDFYSSVDTTVMGSSTYELTLTVEEFPYADKANYVFTRHPPPPGHGQRTVCLEGHRLLREIVKGLAGERHMACRRGTDQHSHAQRGTHRRDHTHRLSPGLRRRHSPLCARSKTGRLPRHRLPVL